MTPVGKCLWRLHTSSTAQVGASDNPADSVPMDRLRMIQQLPKLGQRVERRSLKWEKFSYPSKTEWLKNERERRNKQWFNIHGKMRSLRSCLEFEHTQETNNNSSNNNTTPYYQRLRERLKSRIDAAKVEEILGKKR